MNDLITWAAGVVLGISIGYTVAHAYYDYHMEKALKRTEDIVEGAEKAVRRHRLVMQMMAMQNGRIQVVECPTCEVKLTTAATPFIAPGSQN